MPRLLLALASATLMIAACGGAASPTTNVSTTATGAPTSGNAAPTTPVGGGGGGTAGIPSIADGVFKSGTARVELSGARTETFDVSLATGITTGGNTVLAFATSDSQRVVQLTFLAAGSPDPGAVTVTTLNLSALSTAAGTWGKECQLKITRNNAAGLSGEFACTDAPAVGGATVTKASFKGTFAADR